MAYSMAPDAKNWPNMNHTWGALRALMHAATVSFSRCSATGASRPSAATRAVRSSCVSHQAVPGVRGRMKKEPTPQTTVKRPSLGSAVAASRASGLL